MASNKKSAFSVFKSRLGGNSMPREDPGTDHGFTSNVEDLLILGFAEPKDDQNVDASEPKRHMKRRGSLPELTAVESRLEKEEKSGERTPTNLSKIPRKSHRSEPRLSQLRKSFKRKRKSSGKAKHAAEGILVEQKENKMTKFDTESISTERTTVPGDSMTDLDSLNSYSDIKKAPVCHVKMPSVESLRSTSSSSSVKHVNETSMTGQDLLEWLICPIKPQKFFSEVWERKPLFIKRRQQKYNNGWFSTKELDDILRKDNLRYGVNIDITTYKNGKRETLNPVGRAYPPVVWEFYQEGCSVRLLNPQTFSSSVWKLNSLLQEYFGCFVGSNIYLTPPGSQGFAPHYDDIEAFIIQIEGKKQWKLYSPRFLHGELPVCVVQTKLELEHPEPTERNVGDALPKYSSANLSQDEIGEPILDKILEPGDCLYFPRGTIHQASAPSDSHSLHITLSVYQRNTYGDFLGKLLSRALDIATEEDIEYRRGLPIGYLNHVGVAHSDKLTKERSEFLRRIQQLMVKLASYAPVDAAADQMAIDTLNDMLPPMISGDEKHCSIHGNGAFWDNGRVCGEANFQPDTEVCVLRPGIARIVLEGDKAVIYHTLENSRIYHAVQAQAIEVPVEEADAADHLLHSHPDFVTVDSIPLETYEKKLSLVKLLYDNGILRTRIPLNQDSAV